MRRLVFVLVVTVALTAFAAQMAAAYLVANLNVKSMMDRSSLVCRVKVLSAKMEGRYTDGTYHPTLETGQIVARVRVVSAIKGSPNREIDIDSPSSTNILKNMVMYTGLVPDGTYLVFLKGDSSPYKFADLHNGALAVSASLPKKDYGSTPSDKLLAELMCLAESKDIKTRDLAIEQLGYLGDIRARELLSGFSFTGNPKERAQGLTARIKSGDAPPVEEVLSILCVDTRQSVTNPSPSQVVSRDQSELLMAIVMSVKAGYLPAKVAVRKLEGFDYLSFVKQALECPVIAREDFRRGLVIGILQNLADPKSIPLLVGFLDDHSQRVRNAAAVSFAMIAGKYDYAVGSEKFNADEAKYISYWKAWAKEHPEGK